MERPESADAVLTGVAGVERSYDESVYGDQYGNLRGSGGTWFTGMGVLRLVDVSTDETVWVFAYKPGYSFSGASSRVADKTVEKLLKDARQSDKKK